MLKNQTKKVLGPLAPCKNLAFEHSFEVTAGQTDALRAKARLSGAVDGFPADTRNSPSPEAGGASNDNAACNGLQTGRVAYPCKLLYPEVLGHNTATNVPVTGFRQAQT